MKFLNSKQLRLALIAALGIAALAFIGLSFWGLSTLSEKSKRMVELKVENNIATAKLQSLAKAKNELKEFGYFKNVAKAIIPNDKDQAKTVLEIFQMADQSGIAIESITFPISNLTTAPKTAAPASGSSNAQTATPSKIVSQATPVTGISGLYSVQLTITPQIGTTVPVEKRVSYEKMLDFLDKIERNQRTAQITEVSVQPKFDRDGSISDFNFILTINIFIKP